jgi:subfamily B ATP-binding cassette protein MsbA
MEQKEQVNHKPKKWKIYKRPTGGLLVLAAALVKPYSKWLLLILVAMLLETAMNLLTPWPLKLIIDNVISAKPLPHWLYWMNDMGIEAGTMKLAFSAALALVVFTTVGAVGAYVNGYFTESVAQYVANDLRQKMYHHLQHLSLSYYDSQQVAKILNTITTDVTTIQEFAASSLLKIFIDLLTIAGMLVIMFYLHWNFALIAVGITPFLLFFVARFKKMVKKATREVRKDQTNMAAVIQQGLESIRVVNAFGTQGVEEEKLRKISMETVNAALKARRLKSLLAPTISVTVSICVALILWQGSKMILAGSAMTIGALTVFLSYLNKFFTPVQDLGKITNNIAMATVALERIQLILEADNIIPEKKNAIEPVLLRGDIEFEDVSFSYREDVEVIHHLKLSIKAGERIGICGPTGCGKTTVASLIPRFYDVTTGVVKVDGIDTRDYSLEGLRKQIGFVLQDTVLFFGTIRENIAYGLENATEEQIIEAAKLANAWEFISKMPEGLDTMVGEKGYTLSGGQRQRIGIARAFIRNSPILILDEPTAALDNESEKAVIDALEKLMVGRTVMIIAHRLSTIRHADRIIVMQNGMVAEEGSHIQLLDKEGIYFQLYHMQEKDLEVEPLHVVKNL